MLAYALPVLQATHERTTHSRKTGWPRAGGPAAPTEPHEPCSLASAPPGIVSTRVVDVASAQVQAQAVARGTAKLASE